MYTTTVNLRREVGFLVDISSAVITQIGYYEATEKSQYLWPIEDRFVCIAFNNDIALHLELIILDNFTA